MPRGSPALRPLGWVLLLLWAAAPTASPAPGPSAGKSPLIVAADTDNFPYSYRDDDGVLRGFAVDVFDAIARRMGLDFQRVELSAMDDLEQFRAGAFDLGQFHPRLPASEQDAAYSFPILVLQGAILTREDGPEILSLSEIAARRLKVAAPTQGRLYAIERGIDPSLITFASSPECLQKLRAGEVDVALITRLTGLAQARHLGIRGLRAVATLDGYTVQYCVAAHNTPHGRDLIHVVNEGIAVLQQTGELPEIHRRWFAQDEPKQLGMRELALYITGTLIVALVVALWALLHQRHLRQRISRQTAELAEGRSILAEAQRFAGLGHWQCRLDDPYAAQWSDETFRIFELDRSAHPAPLTGMAEFAAPGDRSRWKAALASLAERGQSFDLTVTIEPRAGLRKIIHARGRPVHDADGQQTGVFGTVQDVTASHEAAEALRRSEQLLRALYSNLPIGLGVVEEHGERWRVLSLNPEARRLLALPGDPPTGTSFHALGLPPRVTEFWIRQFIRCTGEARTIETEWSDDARGRTHAVTVFAVPGHSTTRRCCFLADDVTDRRRTEAELAQGRRLRAIGELVGGIAHEFNNLLTPILLNAQLLEGEWAHEPALRSELSIITDAARRSAELTRRLLAFGRKTERSVSEVNLPEVISANANLVRSTIDRRIVVQSTIAPELPPLHLPGSDLHQVIINLLLNARDTLMEKLAGQPPPGWTPMIEISAALLPAEAVLPIDPARASPPRGWVDCRVRDNGCGMPPEVVERIFEPFYSTKEIGRGTGLGLATVWHLVSEMGGRIEVESAVGAGSTFHVYLPVSDAPPPAAPAPGPGDPAEAGAPGARHVLLVEDEAPIARVVTSLLQRRGHTVTCASDGLRGWEQFVAGPSRFDAIVLDLDMPGISGQEFARRARNLAYTRPIIIVSGRITEADRQVLGELKIDFFVNKPFEPAELFATLDQAFGRPVPAA